MSQYDTVLQAIDVHGHYGNYISDPPALMDTWMSGSIQTVLGRARCANIGLTVVSPLDALLPRYCADVYLANQQAIGDIMQYSELRQWVVLNPLQKETFNQAESILQQPQCVGIKIHPEEHGYHIADYGQELFGFAESHQAVILTHSGEEHSLPSDYVSLVNQYPQVQLVLAHLGCGYDGDPTHQIRAIQQAKHRNMYVDTSSAMNITSGLLEWAVEQIGADRIVFGTDSPLYSASAHRARIDHADITEDQKKCILFHNANELLQLGKEE